MNVMRVKIWNVEIVHFIKKGKGTFMKKLRLNIVLEVTDKDYLKHNLQDIDPLIITRHNVKDEITGVFDNIIPFGIPREILSQLKKSNADIAEITIIDCIDPDFPENYKNNEDVENVE